MRRNDPGRSYKRIKKREKERKKKKKTDEKRKRVIELGMSVYEEERTTCIA